MLQKNYYQIHSVKKKLLTENIDSKRSAVLNKWKFFFLQFLECILEFLSKKALSFSFESGAIQFLHSLLQILIWSQLPFVPNPCGFCREVLLQGFFSSHSLTIGLNSSFNCANTKFVQSTCQNEHYPFSTLEWRERDWWDFFALSSGSTMVWFRICFPLERTSWIFGLDGVSDMYSFHKTKNQAA